MEPDQRQLEKDIEEKTMMLRTILIPALMVIPGILVGAGPASKVLGDFVRVEIPVDGDLAVYACEFSVHAATDGREASGSMYCSRLAGDHPHAWEILLDGSDCVSVDGNFARIGGIVDAVDGSGLLGQYMLFEVRDYGEGKPLPDMLSNAWMPGSRMEVFERWCNGEFNEFGDTTADDREKDFPYGTRQFVVAEGNIKVLDFSD